MWYEDGDKFSRVNVPETFDNLAQKLENNDSVLYQSINLSSTARDSLSSTVFQQQLQKERENDSLNQTGNSSEISDEQNSTIDSLNLSKDYPLDTSFEFTTSSKLDARFESTEGSTEGSKDIVAKLKNRLMELLRISSEQDAILKEKESRIEDLEIQIGALNIEPPKDYKALYQSTKLEYDNFMKSLDKKGMVRTVSSKSVRQIIPSSMKRK